MLRRNKGLMGLCIVLFVLSLVSGNAVVGQTGTTSLRGTVTDKSGAAILGANVKITNGQTGFERSTATGDNGEYEFLALPPGNYTLMAEKNSFRRYEQTNLQLLVNVPATQNITLQVGMATETVEVLAQVPALNTTDASIGIAFNENQVKELPMEGRNVPDLLTLQPGVAYTGNRPDLPASDNDEVSQPNYCAATRAMSRSMVKV